MDSTRFTTAITRKPATSYADGQSSGRYGSPDLEKAVAQHDAYCSALTGCGVRTIVLEPDDRFPDSTFVEDAAVVLPDAAVIMRPGHPSRLGEIEDIREVLSVYRETVDIPEGARIDGGDVLQADQDFFVGLSGRTDEPGARA
ncbi:MAG TPA: hypothetical protein VLA34_12330, partial [Candidatus Krumholzibacterium sp.]|nr:hypothetical protein [Candidatus Krumholzibacterium sp.]